MRLPHLFEFMDQDWVPASLRTTLREILECGNARPFRPYYDWVAGEVGREAKDGGFKNVVELGAGTAPVTRLLAQEPDAGRLTLIPCDLNPDRTAYELLAAEHPGVVAPRLTPVDFSVPHPWEPDTLLFLSATFHHVPPEARDGVLAALTGSARRVMIFEPLQCRVSSLVFVFFSVVPALILPLWFLNRPGTLRRIVWCWLIPLAPLTFWWDGIVSCLRQWGERGWRDAAGRLGLRVRTFDRRLFSYFLTFE